MNKKIKLAILFHKFSPNEGISVSIKRLIENLPGNIEVHLISGRKIKSGYELFKTAIETEKKEKFFRHYFPFINEPEHYSKSLDNFVFVVKKLHEVYNFDILHSYYLFPSGFVSVLCSKLLGIPCVASARGNDIGKNIYESSKFGFTKWTLENADFLTFPNKYHLRLADAISNCKSKSTVVHNSCYFNNPALEKSENEVFTFGYFGDLKRKKGIIYLLEAVEKIQNKNFKVVVVRDIKEDEKKIYGKFIEEKNLDKYIEFVGSKPHSEMGFWYKKIDCFVLPTIDDGCPNVIMEAINSGTPIISTNIDVISEILTNNENSLLVSPRDSVSLTSAMEKIIEDSSLREKFSRLQRNNWIN